MAQLREIVIDCAHPASLARFWSAVLDDWAIRPYDDAEIARLAGLGLTPETDPTVALDGPNGLVIFCCEVPEPKRGKNRLHLDVTAADRGAEVERLVELGATVLAEADGWTVMGDPEGNEFCVADPR